MAPPSARDNSLVLSRSEEGGSDVSLMASASDDRDRYDLSASSASSSPRPRRADGDPSSGGGKAEASAQQNLEALLAGMGGVSPKRRVPHKKDAVGASGSASGNATRKPPRGSVTGADGGRCSIGLVGSIARTIVEEEEEDLAESEGAEGLSRDEGRGSGETCEDGGTRGTGGNGGHRDMSASADAHSAGLLGGASAGASAAAAADAGAATAAAAAAAAAVLTASVDPGGPVALRTHSCRVALAATSPRNVSGCITGGLPAVAAASASASHSEADTEEWAGAASPGCLSTIRAIDQLWSTPFVHQWQTQQLHQHLLDPIMQQRKQWQRQQQLEGQEQYPPGVACTHEAQLPLPIHRLAR
ncbi:unnamed protein product [Closterium sp. Naga37s-1]|nr:unnamed protein product [Closterium sp. Naga37s-1]